MIRIASLFVGSLAMLTASASNYKLLTYIPSHHDIAPYRVSWQDPSFMALQLWSPDGSVLPTPTPTPTPSNSLAVSLPITDQHQSTATPPPPPPVDTIVAVVIFSAMVAWGVFILALAYCRYSTKVNSKPVLYLQDIETGELTEQS